MVVKRTDSAPAEILTAAGNAPRQLDLHAVLADAEHGRDFPLRMKLELSKDHDFPAAFGERIYRGDQKLDTFRPRHLCRHDRFISYDVQTGQFPHNRNGRTLFTPEDIDGKALGRREKESPDGADWVLGSSLPDAQIRRLHNIVDVGDSRKLGPQIGSKRGFIRQNFVREPALVRGIWGAHAAISPDVRCREQAFSFPGSP